MLFEKGSEMFPEVTIDETWHIGFLNPAASDRTSYEGDLLSVSECPSSWMHIARLGGDLWRVEHAGGRFLDAHAFFCDENCKSILLNWGLDEGLLRRCTLFNAVQFDEQLDRDLVYSFENMKDLEKEFDLDNVDVTTDTSCPVLTDAALKKYGLSANGSQFNLDYVLIDFLQQSNSQTGSFVGIFWNDEFDPSGLSAPRAGILPKVADKMIEKGCVILEERSPDEVEQIWLDHHYEGTGYSF